ncbi:MAG: hypothetical protein LBB88_10650 [Planctomycetaceae bacterium]|jgi:hypothetical protein|nr:hypothetical protein [Planctomycetaceae bacterium]
MNTTLSNSFSELEIEKLISDLRSSVLQRNPLKERLEKLRKLCDATRATGEWKDDLAEHERERLYEIDEILDYDNFYDLSIDELESEIKSFQNNSSFLVEVKQKIRRRIIANEEDLLNEIHNGLQAGNYTPASLAAWIKTIGNKKWRYIGAKAKEIYEEVQYNYIRKIIKSNKDIGESRKTKLEQACNTLQKMSYPKAALLLAEYNNELNQIK